MDVASPIAERIAGQPRADTGRFFTVAMENKLATNWAKNGAFADAAGDRAVPYRRADRPPAEGYGRPT